MKKHNSQKLYLFSDSSCNFNEDLCGFLAQNINIDDQGIKGQGAPLWYRVKGGDSTYPRGHISDPLTSSGDHFALFDVKNYQHRPLDRGFLIAPKLPLSKEQYCVRLVIISNNKKILPL